MQKESPTSNQAAPIVLVDHRGRQETSELRFTSSG
jgi:hypothetical protein